MISTGMIDVAGPHTTSLRMREWERKLNRLEGNGRQLAVLLGWTRGWNLAAGCDYPGAGIISAEPDTPAVLRQASSPPPEAPTAIPGSSN